MNCGTIGRARPMPESRRPVMRRRPGRTHVECITNRPGRTAMTAARVDQAGTAGFASKLAGRIALVTGGTRGIGAAISRSLANQGATVAAGYGRDREHAERFLAEIHAEGVT